MLIRAGEARTPHDLDSGGGTSGAGGHVREVLTLAEKAGL